MLLYKYNTKNTHLYHLHILAISNSVAKSTFIFGRQFRTPKIHVKGFWVHSRSGNITRPRSICTNRIMVTLISSKKRNCGYLAKAYRCWNIQYLWQRKTRCCKWKMNPWYSIGRQSYCFTRLDEVSISRALSDVEWTSIMSRENELFSVAIDMNRKKHVL